MRLSTLFTTALSLVAATSLTLALAPASQAATLPLPDPGASPLDTHGITDIDSTTFDVTPSVPVRQGKPGVDTTLAQARKAAGITTGTAYPFDNPRNFEIPDPDAAYKHVPWLRTPGCTLTKKNPYPVVLVHGTWANAQKWETLAPYLEKAGQCIYAINYGFDARSPIYNDPAKGTFATLGSYSSAIELNNFINQILRETGAKKVNLVGHSQAGFIFRLWLHDFRGYQRTSRVVTLGGTNHGTDMMGIAQLVPVWNYPWLAASAGVLLSKAAMGQLVGSPMHRYIESLPETMPSVKYTVITTKDDNVSTPYNAGFLKAGPRAEVSNVVVQDVCKVDHKIDHNDLTTDPIAAQLVVRGLQGKKVVCTG